MLQTRASAGALQSPNYPAKRLVQRLHRGCLRSQCGSRHRALGLPTRAIVAPQGDVAVSFGHRKQVAQGEARSPAAETPQAHAVGKEDSVDAVGTHDVLHGHEAADAAAHSHGLGVPAEAAAAAVDAADQAAAVAEAVHVAGQQIAQESSEYTEVEEEVKVRTFQDYLTDTKSFLTSSATGRGVSIAAAAFLGGTFIIALYRTYQKSNTAWAQRKRMVDKNKQLVQGLSAYLPSRRSELTPGVVNKLCRGGFTPVEVFRKYLWYLLRERSFDPEAVQDMVQLKAALGLSDDEVAEALQERAKRMYDKYGTLMLNTEGMTPEGIERKATCQALVSKLLYLTEYQPLVSQGSEAFKATDLRMIFGATDEDLSKLRIESLADVDSSSFARMMGTGGDSEEEWMEPDEPFTGGSSSSSRKTPDSGSGSSSSREPRV